MRMIHVAALSVLLALTAFAVAPRTARAQDSTLAVSPRVHELLTRLTVAGQARDSLSKLADKATGDQQATLEEQVWQRQLEVQAVILEATNELAAMKAPGGDSLATRVVLRDALSAGWPLYRRQLERRERMMNALLEKRDAATPKERLEIETQFAQDSDRVARMYRDLVDAVIAVENVGIDASVQRKYVTEKVTRVSEQTKARMVVLGRAQASAAARLQRAPEDAVAQTELEAATAAVDQTTHNLETEISILKRLGKDTTDLKVELIVARGTLTSAIFERGVLSGLFRHGRQQFVDMLAARGPHWLFTGLTILLLLVGFWLLSRLMRWLVGRAVAGAKFSHLLKATIVSWTSGLVFLIGVVIVLKQLGLQLGPMLAGLGIAGFVLGFALQDTLSNFAAGGMILAYQPYDVGDLVEAGGASGTVRQMSLVSTTILTADNQTLIVPNKKMWGDVIRNMTSQHTRRVDLTFAAGHENDLAAVEALLLDIAGADERVLKSPAPVVKLNQLTEDAVHYIVRVWTRQENYWDVYWDFTRAVKLRFDKEGISFPRPDLNVTMIGVRPDAPA